MGHDSFRYAAPGIGIHARPRWSNGRRNPNAIRREQLHQNGRTDDYLHCLAQGAAVVDPGDLDAITEWELVHRAATGELTCEWNHGRRVWKRA